MRAVSIDFERNDSGPLVYVASRLCWPLCAPMPRDPLGREKKTFLLWQCSGIIKSMGLLNKMASPLVGPQASIVMQMTLSLVVLVPMSTPPSVIVNQRV